MKKAITIALILMISILLVACSRKPEIKVNETVTEGLPEDESSAPIIQPEIQPEDNLAGNDDAMNATPANNTETEIISEPEEPEIILEEEPLRPTDDECIADLVESCTGTSEMECTDKPILNVSAKTLTLKVKNSLGYTIELKNLVWFIEDELRECMTQSIAESTQVRVNGSDFVDINTNPEVLNDQTFELKISLSSVEKEYLDQSFDLNYIDPSSNSIDYSFVNLKILAIGR